MQNSTDEQRKNIPWIGIFFILVGFVLLLETLDIINLGRIIGDWWPLVFIVIGLGKLRGSRKGTGVGFLVLGAIFLGAELDIINWQQLFRLWPLALVIIGVYLILRQRKIRLFPTGDNTVDSDYINANAIFGGFDQTFTSQRLRGGEVSAIFGGVEIDLTRSTPVHQDIEFTINAMFGGAEIRVPENWRVVVKGTPILGGIESSARTQESGQEIFTVIFDCSVAFGGIEIRN